MSNSYKVIVTGVADVRDQEKTPITDPALLQKLDGIEYRDDNFTDYLEGPNERSLAEVLNPGGDIALKFDKTTGFLLYVTEYEATRELTKDELKLLLEYTTGQWSDGIGSGFNSYCWDNHDTWMDYPSYAHMNKSRIIQETVSRL